MLTNSLEIDNKKVFVFDNVLDFSHRLDIYNFVKNSHFYIGWQDTDVLERKKYVYMHSKYSETDMKVLDIYNKIKNNNLKNFFEQNNWKDTVVNLSFPSNTHFMHTHNDLTCLYYVNCDWKEEYGGETLFYNEQNEIQFSSIYKPGRFLIFDGSIPHTIRSQSFSAPDFRFTMAMRFEQKLNWYQFL